VADLGRAGALVSSATTGSGVDIIAFNATLRHLYVPAADAATLHVLAVSPSGQLSSLGTAVTVSGAHCVTADDRGNAWTCDPDRGELLIYTDNLPPVVR